MALRTTIDINVDFYDKKYILINAKQNDKKSRFLSVTCYNRGALYPINSGEHAAFLRYKKADEHSVFSFCDINARGKIIVELTEQMLAADGICCADLVIVNKGDAIANPDTGEITVIDNGSVLSTMTFFVDVSETSVANAEIESTGEYHGLSELLVKAEADYKSVILSAQSWAIGGTDTRTNEDTDNAKYYAQQSSNSANNASLSAASASASASTAQTYMSDALKNKELAQTYMNNAKTYMENAKASETNAATSASNASTSETNASQSATAAQDSKVSAANSASSASTSATNAYNYYLQAEAITNGLNGAFLPKGTITFAELAELKENETVAAGYLYNISDNFVTDDTFRMGAGVSYEAGTNVYFTADGAWDCLAGTTVTGVKGGAETTYRKGNVNLTADHIGAIPVTDIATVDEMKDYLGII